MKPKGQRLQYGHYLLRQEIGAYSAYAPQNASLYFAHLWEGAIDRETNVDICLVIKWARAERQECRYEDLEHAIQRHLDDEPEDYVRDIFVSPSHMTKADDLASAEALKESVQKYRKSGIA